MEADVLKLALHRVSGYLLHHHAFDLVIVSFGGTASQKVKKNGALLMPYNLILTSQMDNNILSQKHLRCKKRRVQESASC